MEGEKIIVERILSDLGRKVLDVGCGDGKWSEYLFGKVRRLDGIEIWTKNIVRYELGSKYNRLFHMDILHFDGFGDYDVLIFGDVLEHLPQERALSLIEDIKRYRLTVYLTIPISLCVQDGEAWGNPYESHLYQWTHEELVDLGFVQLHEGFNPNGRVKIGSYELTCGT